MKLIILYGSQTGNSQDLAERIWKQAVRHLEKESNNIYLNSFEEFNFEALSQLNDNNNTRFLFVCSTTGQGDVCKEFIRIS
jgi:sulfite reductase alpha subunit-like flavoprotein